MRLVEASRGAGRPPGTPAAGLARAHPGGAAGPPGRDPACTPEDADPGAREVGSVVCLCDVRSADRASDRAARRGVARAAGLGFG